MAGTDLGSWEFFSRKSFRDRSSWPDGISLPFTLARTAVGGIFGAAASGAAQRGRARRWADRRHGPGRRERRRGEDRTVAAMTAS